MLCSPQNLDYKTKNIFAHVHASGLPKTKIKTKLPRLIVKGQRRNRAIQRFNTPDSAYHIGVLEFYRRRNFLVALINIVLRKGVRDLKF